MGDTRINVYKSNGTLLGYFLNPTITAFEQSDYEISGSFFGENGDSPNKVPFNPEAQPHMIDLPNTGSKNFAHSQLINVYVQRGRQPVTMTGRGK